MLRYSLAKAVDRPKGTRATLPPITPRLAPEIQYRAALRRLLTAAAKEVRESVIPLYEAERTIRAYTGDADPNWFVRLRAMINELTGVVNGTVRSILDLEGKQHTKGFMAAAKKALGIDLAAVIHDEDIADYVETAVARNVSLITGFSDDLIKRIEQTVYENSIAGNTVATLKAKLKEQFGISDRRAQLIARDQIGKFNSDLNRTRQTQAGVTEYGFLTSNDERVRKNHSAMEGKTCRWDDASKYRADDGTWQSRSSIGGVNLHPGQDYQCRCVSRGIVVF